MIFKFIGTRRELLNYLRALMAVHGDAPLKEVLARVSKNPACY